MFFPKAEILPEEERILERCSVFAEAGAVHLVMQFLAQEQKVPEAERKRINVTKATNFFPACAQRLPPPPPMPDPAALCGWDREKQKETITGLQDQCAYMYLACDRLAFVATTPEMQQYARNDPAKSYNELANYLLSPLYSLIFVAKMKAGVQGLRDLLADLFTKLTILHEAAHEQVSAPKPHEVILSLCTDVGLPALKDHELDGQAADEIRNLFNTVRELSTHDPQFQFQINLQDMMRPAIRVTLLGIAPTLLGSVDLLGSLERYIKFTVPFGGWIIPILREKLIETEMAKRIRMFGESTGRRHELWQ